MYKGLGTCVSSLSSARILSILFLFLLAALHTFAQSTATLQGTVSDPSGRGIPGATVLATNQATGV